MRDYSRELEIAVALSRDAGKRILELWRGEKVPSEMKGDGSPVTEADRIANNIILSGLRENFPGYGIVSEEGDGSDSPSDPTWYVDPLDGTRSFLLGLPGFAVQIGLAGGGRPILGVVHNPPSGETIYGIVGAGAYLTGPGPSGPTPLPERGANDSFGLANSASIGLRLSSVARGFSEYAEIGPGTLGSSWDYCAPEAVVLASGGVVEYSDGTPLFYSGAHLMRPGVVASRNRETLEKCRKNRA